MSTPQNKTIRNVIAFLDELGLSVYGQCRDLNDGCEYETGSLMDYTADDIIKLRKHIRDGTLYSYNEPR